MLAGLSGFALSATGAVAQTAPKATGASEVEEVVITGSRIRRTEYNSPSPVSIIDAESASLQGSIDITSMLQSSALGATAQQINNNFTGFVTTGGGGANTLSLRGLGAQRTLTLINGRRAGPAGVGGTVGPFDFNVIPTAQVQNIEILTGGASSVYGSDAVAGVVNVFTHTKGDELKLDVTGVVPFEQGGDEYTASLSKGWTFNRGYISAAAQIYENKGLRYKDRDYLNCPVDYISTGDRTQRLDLVTPDGNFKCINTLTGIYIRAGLRYVADPTVTANGFNLNGFRRVNATIAQLNGDIDPVTAGLQPIYATLVPACVGQNVPTAVTAACSTARRDFARANQTIQPTDSPIQGYRHAISPVKRYSVFLTGEYDLTDNAKAYGEVLLNKRESTQRSLRQINATVAAANPTNPFNVANNPAYNNGPYGALAASTAQALYVLSVNRDQEVDYSRFVGGVKGDLPASLPIIGDWAYDIYGQYSKSDGTYGQDFIYNDRVLAVTGAAQCNQALVTISANSPNPTCPANFNFLRASTISNAAPTAAEYAFLNGYETGHTTYTHALVEGSMTGDIFKLPAGPVGAAVGFHIRKEEIDDQPGFNSRNSNYNGSSAAGATVGSDTVKELFGEIDAPLWRDDEHGQKLTVNLSGRYSDYKSYGASSTYKASMNFQLSPTVMVRATTGTNFRAPALYELYLGSSTSFLAQLGTDPCYQYGSAGNLTDRQRANCASLGISPTSTHGGAGSIVITAQGGQGVLDAETADSWTAGFVWTPKFINFNMTLDYSEIEILNQVQRYGTGNILTACTSAVNFPNNTFCSLVTRNLDTASPTFGAVLTVRDAYLNVAKQWNHSLDLNMTYIHEKEWGKVTLTGAFTWQLEWYTKLDATSPTLQNQGFTGFPDFAGTTGVRYDRGDWTFALASLFIGKTSDVDDAISGFGTDLVTYREDTGAYAKRHLEFYASHDISVRRKFTDKHLDVIVGVKNVLDEQPPFYSSASSSRISNLRLTSQYDLLGRRAFVTVKKAW